MWIPGKIYENAMVIALQETGFDVKNQYPITVKFRGYIVGDYFADLIIEEKVIVELKAIDKLSKTHEIQLVNYLNATGINVGLLLNFGPRPQIKRRVFSKKKKR